MRFVIGAVLAALVASAPPSHENEEPELVVRAQRLHMIPPGLKGRGYAKRIDFRARLDGEPDEPESYYCLDEVWDWGDGTESVYAPDCDPYEGGSELKRDFADSHHFGPGTWRIAFALMNLDDIVIQGTFEVRIY